MNNEHNFPPGEELKDKVCIMCDGLKTHDGETCFHCKGIGTTKWPVRCKGNCQTCKDMFKEERAPNPEFKVGDRVVWDAPAINGHGSQGVVIRIEYQPCWGNVYYIQLEGQKFESMDSDHNIWLSKSRFRIIGKEMKITDFFGGDKIGQEQDDK
jgi:hypothetical protein